ncbi:MAG: hypothetical protein OXU86_06225 [Thaumarchaeota archaeon]|nr:hypothetical protein [Nitrososphaerota archaeon]RNJ72405.1 MAG: hypothetical protein EB833_04830 [Thaumarchaeota archaeon S13]MDD9809759.1 hypothetical protein [Nitrososphaerota archaeon]MDD9814236.1 hypothetical protein [Nitrososphaerota archaeon]MDD9826347.1 hypothetical protein [Nitrososphaerota archaeon]
MASSESFGAQEGHGERVVAWINERAAKDGARLEARLYGHTIRTRNFGSFEMFSWVGDARAARRAVVRASRRFRVRVIEGGYKARERVLSTRRVDYAMVRDGERVLGRLKFEAPRLRGGPWALCGEELR